MNKCIINLFINHIYITLKSLWEWETIVIPINDMYASFRGRRLYMKNYDNTFFEELSILAGNKKNENFNFN